MPWIRLDTRASLLSLIVTTVVLGGPLAQLGAQTAPGATKPDNEPAAPEKSRQDPEKPKAKAKGTSQFESRRARAATLPACTWAGRSPT